MRDGEFSPAATSRQASALFGDEPTLPDLAYGRLMREAAAESGVSRGAMVWDWIGSFLSKRRLFGHEYLAHRLYALAPEERRRFIGVWASQAFNRVMNELADGHGIVGQKLMFNTMLRGFGLPTPELQAVARRWGTTGAIPCLPNAEAVATFLRSEARYPLFGKPVRASLSRGALSVDGYDAATDRLVLVDGATVDTTALAAEVIDRYGDGGYMFETRLAPHPELAAVSGKAIGTLRFVTVSEAGRARPLYVLWKVPARDAVADTTWRSGNMLAEVDPDSGAVLRCQLGSGPSRRTPIRHPETDAPIVGRRLPDWTAARALALSASDVTPLTRLIGWDLALTDRGPVLVEANGDPNHTLYQLAADRGFLTDDASALRDRIAVENAARLRARKGGRRRAQRALVGRYVRKALGFRDL